MWADKTSVGLILRTFLLLVEKPGLKYVHIDSADEVEYCNYGVYGCFSVGWPWSEHKPKNLFPMAVEEMRVNYLMHTRQNKNKPFKLYPDNVDLIRQANINPVGPFYFISHGYTENGTMPWINTMADALLNLDGNDAATVFAIDWSGGSGSPYLQAVANIRLVGVMTAHFIKNIYDALQLPDLNNFHFIGHSLGAHLGGYCGSELHKRFRLKLGRITGMDPAGPYFDGTVTLVRLDRSDAKYVDIIHSNAKPMITSISEILTGGFGIVEPIGHVDFYPNNGSVQPGCSNSDYSNLNLKTVVNIVACNHARSYEFFTESIANGNTCPFMGVQCPSFDEFIAGNCSCDSKHLCIPMGYHSYKTYKHLEISGMVDGSNSIVMYSVTGDKGPYCRKQYKIVLELQDAKNSGNCKPVEGNVEISLADKNKIFTDSRSLNKGDKSEKYIPGQIRTRLLGFRDTGLRAVYATVKFDKTAVFEFFTTQACIAVKYVKVISIEYNTEITLCTRVLNKQTPGAVLNHRSVGLKSEHCKNLN